jgi:YVTN family beta-propeller protein
MTAAVAGTLTPDRATAAQLPTPVPITVGASPLSVAVDPVTHLVYAANSGSFLNHPGSVSVINPSVPVGRPPQVVATVAVGRFPSGIAVDPVNDRIYVANAGSNSVSVIDGHRNRVIATVGVGARPSGVGVIPATGTVYVANSGSGKAPGTVSVISTATNHVVKLIPVGYDPDGIGVNTISRTVYVGNQGGAGSSNGYQGTVSIIRGTSVGSTVTVQGTPYGIGVNSLTNNVYVANVNEEEGGASQVALINNSGRLVSQVPLADPDAQGVAVNESTGDVFVAHSYSGQAGGPIGSLSVINGKTNGEALDINVGGNPWGIAVDPGTDRVYLANDTSPGTVTEVDFSGYPITGGTPPPTIPTTTTTTPASLNGTLCGVLIRSGAVKTVGITKYYISENHSVDVTAYGQCRMGGVVPNGQPYHPEPDLALLVQSSLPETPGETGKPLPGVGKGAELYAEGELPFVLFPHGKQWVELQGGFDIEVTQTRLNLFIPKLVAAAGQVYRAFG